MENCPGKELLLPLEGPAERGQVPLPHQDRRAAAGGIRRSPPTTDNVSLTLAKAGTGTCRNSLNSGCWQAGRRQSRSIPARMGEREMLHTGSYLTLKIEVEGNKKP